MNEKKLRIGKKGGAKKIAKEFAKIRKAPLSKDVFTIIEEHHKKDSKKPAKKSARPRDLEN